MTGSDASGMVSPQRATGQRCSAANAEVIPMSEIATTVREIIVEHLGVPEHEVTLEASFVDDLAKQA